MTTDTTTLPLAPRARRQGAGARLLRDPLGVGALVVMVAIVLLCTLAPLLTAFDPDRSDLSAALLPPGGEHPLGTDSAGRDIWARLLYGGRYTLLGAAVAMITAAVIGIVAGLVAGYFQGVFDAVTSWLASLLMALPGIIVLLAARAAVGQSLWGIMVIFGVLMSPSFFRLTRTIVAAVRKELFVDAARVAGIGDTRIIAVHVLSVVRGPLIIQAAMILGISVGVQAGLEFLALGDRSLPSWGSMLNEAFTRIYSEPILLLWPSLAITLWGASLALFGNALRDALEPTPIRAPRRPSTRAADAVIHDDTNGTGDVLLSVRDLRVGYPAPGGGTTIVVDEVGFDVEKGEVLGVIGESGSGKTQTAFAIMGLLPTGGHIVGGSVLWEGTRLDAGAARELRGRRIAYIPQEPLSNLDPSFTIGSQLVEPLRRHKGLTREQARTCAIELLARVGILHPERVFRSYPHEISGGMAQRVLIAGAVSCDPDLLIADEPTTALDVTVQAEILDLLRELQRERGMAVLLVTHNFGVVADICDRVIVMRNGRIVESGGTETVFSSPTHPYTRALLDAILDGSAIREAYQEAQS